MYSDTHCFKICGLRCIWKCYLLFKKSLLFYLKDPRHAVTSTFSDSTLQHVDLNELWNSSYRQNFLGAMDITSVHRCSVPEFDFRRDIYFHEYMKYYNIKLFSRKSFLLSFSSRTLSLNKFEFIFWSFTKCVEDHNENLYFPFNVNESKVIWKVIWNHS